MPLDKMTVSFDLPVDRTADEVRAVLESLGAQRIHIYLPQKSSERPMRGGYPE